MPDGYADIDDDEGELQRIELEPTTSDDSDVDDSVRLYLRDIGRIDRLKSIVEEINLAYQIELGLLVEHLVKGKTSVQYGDDDLLSLAEDLETKITHVSDAVSAYLKKLHGDADWEATSTPEACVLVHKVDLVYGYHVKNLSEANRKPMIVGLMCVEECNSVPADSGYFSIYRLIVTHSIIKKHVENNTTPDQLMLLLSLKDTHALRQLGRKLNMHEVPFPESDNKTIDVYIEDAYIERSLTETTATTESTVVHYDGQPLASIPVMR